MSEPWSIAVRRRYGGYKTVFQVGVQGFVLAVDCDGSHCRFIKRMFIAAMKKAGAPLPSKAPRRKARQL